MDTQAYEKAGYELSSILRNTVLFFVDRMDARDRCTVLLVLGVLALW